MKKDQLNQNFESLAEDVRLHIQKATEELNKANQLVLDKTGHTLGDFAYYSRGDEEAIFIEDNEESSDEESEIVEERLYEVANIIGEESSLVRDMVRSVGWSTSGWYC